MPSRSRRLREDLAERLSSVHDLDGVLRAADAVIRPAIGAAGGAWSTVDPATLLGTSCRVLVDFGDGPVELPHDPDRERANFAVEWEDTEPNTFPSMWRDGRAAALLRCDVSDYRQVGRFEGLLEPLGASDEARMLLSEGDVTWGTVVFYRMGDGTPFDSRSAADLIACAPLVGAAIRRALLTSALDAPGIASPPGSLVLDADDSILVTSAAAEDLLGILGEHHARTALTSLAAATRQHGPTSTRVIGEAGVVVLHAESAKGSEGALAVIVERPRPIELAPLIIESLGLSARQRQVTEALLAGAGRAAIAHQYGIAENTVAETTSAVFRKAGVASRAELCARVFAEFYEAPHHAGATPSPFGYFLPGLSRPPAPSRP